MKPLPTLVHTISLVARPQVKFRTSHWKMVINPVLDINTVCLHVRRFPCPALLEQSVPGVSPESSARTLSKKEIVDDYDSPDRLQTEISATSTEMTGGSPPADIDICDGPDRLQIDISATSTKMTGGSPPAEIGISKSPDRLQTEISVTSMEMAGGSPPALVDICVGPDRIQTEISVTAHVNDDMNTDLPESSAVCCVVGIADAKPENHKSNRCHYGHGCGPAGEFSSDDRLGFDGCGLGGHIL